ncbi:MAG: hypothetical protein AB1665_07845, partial [Candidatus Thermoplasmatota archaeon]
MPLIISLIAYSYPVVIEDAYTFDLPTHSYVHTKEEFATLFYSLNGTEYEWEIWGTSSDSPDDWGAAVTTYLIEKGVPFEQRFLYFVDSEGKITIRGQWPSIQYITSAESAGDLEERIMGEIDRANYYIQLNYSKTPLSLDDNDFAFMDLTILYLLFLAILCYTFVILFFISFRDGWLYRHLRAGTAPVWTLLCFATLGPLYILLSLFFLGLSYLTLEWECGTCSILLGAVWL